MSTTVSYPEDVHENETTYNLQLTKKEINLILECLLFSSSVNIGSDWIEEDFLSMIDAAKKLKKHLLNQVDLKNLVLYKEENYEDSWTEELRKEFGKYIQQEIELEKA